MYSLGILAGSSSGTLVAAALRYCQEQKTPQRVVTFVVDSGNKYLSKMYNDHWMADHGLRRGPTFGDLRDLIIRRHADGAVPLPRLPVPMPPLCERCWTALFPTTSKRRHRLTLIGARPARRPCDR